MKRLRHFTPIVIALVLLAVFGRGLLHRGGYDVTPGGAQDPASAFSDGRPNLVGAMFYSAWCSACQALDPKIRNVTPQFEGRAIEFAKFDFTMGRPPSLLDQAKELGVERVYEQNLGATGFMALIDRRDQRVLGTITMRDGEASIAARINAAIKTVSVQLAPIEPKAALN